MRAKEKGLTHHYSIFIHEKIGRTRLPILGKYVDSVITQALEKADMVYAVTKKVADTVVVFDPNLKGKVIDNMPGIEKKSDPLPLSSRKKRIISVSIWDLGRKPEIYLEISKRVSDYEVLMVGHWRVKWLKDKFLDKVREEGIENLRVVEGVSEEELSRLYAESVVTVRFGFGEYGPAMATLESLANGTPLIVNEDLGTAEYVKSFSAGIVVKEPSETYNALSSLVLDYDKFVSGVKKIVSQITWTKHIEKLILPLKSSDFSS